MILAILFLLLVIEVAEVTQLSLKEFDNEENNIYNVRIN